MGEIDDSISFGSDFRICFGGVGRQLTPNEIQHSEAALVARLPDDFPIDNWESLNTKQQRKAMQFSGLNDQEQWQLLNASASLKALANMNAAQAGPYRKDASILTSLQNGLLRERIDAAFGMPKRGTTDDAVGGPQSTPKPGNTPLPQPGAMPEIDADGLFQKFQQLIQLSLRQKVKGY